MTRRDLIRSMAYLGGLAFSSFSYAFWPDRMNTKGVTRWLSLYSLNTCKKPKVAYWMYSYIDSSLDRKKKGVATNSYHTLGRAVDIRIEGIPLESLRDLAISLRAGGVGYYPRSSFVHLDTGPFRCW